MYLDLKKKTLNCIQMTLKLAQFCDDPQKISTKSSYPQKIFIFLKPPKNIEIQKIEPPKNGPSLRMCENIRVPPPWGSVTGPRGQTAFCFHAQLN